MCRGMNINEPGINNSHSPDQSRTYVEVCVSNIQNFTKHASYKDCSCARSAQHHISTSECSEISDCTYWALFELLAHSGADLTPVLDQPPLWPTNLPIGHTLQDLLPVQKPHAQNGCRLHLSIVEKIVSIVWMYHPPSKPLVDTFVQDLLHEVNDGNTRSTLIQLEEMVRSIRPLQLLCKLRILQLVPWKDVQQLPLPQSLQQYVCIGNEPLENLGTWFISVQNKE